MPWTEVPASAIQVRLRALPLLEWADRIAIGIAARAGGLDGRQPGLQSTATFGGEGDTRGMRSEEEEERKDEPPAAPLVFARGAAEAAPQEGGASGGGRIHRPARLFVAGDYPDKAVTISEADLEAIIARFAETREAGATVPVKVEHRDSPLDPLGEVVALYRSGPELFGMLAFSQAADALLRERAVQSLSVSLLPEASGTFRLMEASVTIRPRVAGAGFLNPKVPYLPPAPSEAEGEKERSGGEALLARFRAEGKLTPATEPTVRALLALGGEGGSGNGSPLVFGIGPQVVGETVAALVARWLSALPVIQPRGGATLAAAKFNREENDNNDDDAEIPPLVRRAARRLGVSAPAVWRRYKS